VSFSPKSPDTYRKALEWIAEKGHREGEVFRAFARICACCVACGHREQEYLEEVKRWSADELNLFAAAFALLVQEMGRQPYADLLGVLWMEWGSKSDQQRRGEFYTPREVCRMAARMTIDVNNLPQDRPVSIMEPCSGAGSMMLAAAEAIVDAGNSPLRMRATCIDIERTGCDMCFTNLTLWGIPCEVIHGNALTDEVWSSWRNIFYYMAHGAGSVKPEPVAAPEFTVAAAMAEAKQNARGQFLMDLDEVSA
jgi:hypothetical protein